MKLTFGLMMATAFAASLATATDNSAEHTAYTGQDVGTIKVDSANSNVLVAVAFKEMGTDRTANISVSNLISNANLIEGDKIFVYTSAGYWAWQLNAQKMWEALGKVSGSGYVQGQPADSVNPDIGEGFWLVRTPTQERPLDKPFYIFGGYVQPSTTTAAAGVKTLMGNPALTNATPTITGAVWKDQIGLIAGDGKLLKTYSYSNTGKWMVASKGTGLPVESQVTIPKGVGFWYNSQATNGVNVTFKW